MPAAAAVTPARIESLPSDGADRQLLQRLERRPAARPRAAPWPARRPPASVKRPLMLALVGDLRAG